MERAGLKVNCDKTKMMKVMLTQAEGVITGQDLLEEGESFQYLHSIINTTGGNNEDINAHTSKPR